jgi:hypothetical protein
MKTYIKDFLNNYFPKKLVQRTHTTILPFSRKPLPSKSENIPETPATLSPITMEASSAPTTLTMTNLKIVVLKSLKELGGKIFQIVFMVSE